MTSERERNLLLTRRFVDEVDLYGLEGFFERRFEDAHATVEALRSVGLGYIADGLLEAMGNVCGQGWPLTRSALKEALTYTEECDTLDDRLYWLRHWMRQRDDAIEIAILRYQSEP